MSFKVVDLEPAPPAIPAAAIPKASIDAEQVQAMLSAAVTAAIARAQGEANRIIEETRKAVTPRDRLMVVEVDGKRGKLKHAACAILPRLVINAKLGINTLIVGPAGSGKTFAGGQLAEALGLEFAHTCMTAGASETWLFGRQTPTGFVEAPFSKLYKLGGVFLADEIDAADANLLLCINTALANGHMFNPISGEMIARHKDFVFVAAANTFGKGGNGVYNGRSRLDAATLDRFETIVVDYDLDVEAALCPDDELREKLQDARYKLRELNAQEIISTRRLERAYLQKQAGVSESEIFASLTASWPKELVDQCGLKASKPKPKAKKPSDNQQAEAPKEGAEYAPF
jgi:cobaltochelatase CobS